MILRLLYTIIGSEDKECENEINQQFGLNSIISFHMNLSGWEY